MWMMNSFVIQIWSEGRWARMGNNYQFIDDTPEKCDSYIQDILRKTNIYHASTRFSPLGVFPCYIHYSINDPSERINVEVTDDTPLFVYIYKQKFYPETNRKTFFVNED